jgi:aspartate/methionine/tyrosine aminotransferase
MIKDNFIKNKQFITISDNIYDNFYFESDAILTLLTNHTSDGLIDVLEQKIKKLL